MSLNPMSLITSYSYCTALELPLDYESLWPFTLRFASLWPFCVTSTSGVCMWEKQGYKDSRTSPSVESSSIQYFIGSFLTPKVGQQTNKIVRKMTIGKSIGKTVVKGLKLSAEEYVGVRKSTKSRRQRLVMENTQSTNIISHSNRNRNPYCFRWMLTRKEWWCISENNQ